jgi:hypothetical protein
VIQDDVFNELATEIDRALMGERERLSPFFLNYSSSAVIQRLLIAALHPADVEKITDAFLIFGFSVTLLSAPSDLNAKNGSILLLGYPKEAEKTAIEVLQRNCTHPPLFLGAPAALAHLTQSAPFSSSSSPWVCAFDVEHFESF